MSGEKSKSSGETGENIVNKFFEKVGWPNSDPNISFACHFGNDHKEKDAKNPRTQHGVDESFSYISGLESETVVQILASVKHTTGKYAQSLTNPVKEFIDDIAFSSKCFQVSEHYNNIYSLFSGSTIKEVKRIPVLFYLASGDDPNANYVQRFSNTQYFKKFEDLEEFHIVDNSKITFMLNAINHVSNTYHDFDINFSHTSTSLNVMTIGQRTYSKTMPVEYLTLPYLAFVLKKGSEGEEIFKYVVVTSEPFSQDGLSRHTFGALASTADKVSSISICFPDYFRDEHQTDVNKVMTTHGLTKSFLKIENYIPNFRSLNNE
ncbi:hypothetical protein HRJ45_15590 [Vibrio coralliilyticus]|uniref:hypothetical protein n=1 Tax=Vibrio coralliilyticus TaxID=190893 RepID=UPI00156107AF|nr:hypothetical protein [Vibrio coralliilyticus]NRF26365.1 hypothetical protein [Vibrio coralliilyticus]NRF80534.1 hypothetical protein [Vibrio coralliilyticus]